MSLSLSSPAFVPAIIEHRYPLSRLGNERKECEKKEKVLTRAHVIEWNEARL